MIYTYSTKKGRSNKMFCFSILFIISSKNTQKKKKHENPFNTWLKTLALMEMKKSGLTIIPPFIVLNFLRFLFSFLYKMSFTHKTTHTHSHRIPLPQPLSLFTEKKHFEILSPLSWVKNFKRTKLDTKKGELKTLKWSHFFFGSLNFHRQNKIAKFINIRNNLRSCSCSMNK